MRKTLVAVAGFVAVCAAALAGGVGDTTGYAYLNIAWPTTYSNGTAYSTGSTTNAFDATAYNGRVKLIVFVSGDQGTVANTNTDKVFLQEATYATGTWSTVTSIASSMPTLGTTAKVATVNMDLDALKNFLRIGVITSSMGETSAIHTVGAVMVSTDKN